MATPSDPASAATASGTARAARPSTELQRELQDAVDEIARGDYIVLSPDELDRWAETGVPPWPEDFPG